MTPMEHYAHLAKLHGLSVSGVIYRLGVGKPLGDKKHYHKGAMDYYRKLSEKHGLSISGVRYRLRTGKPFEDEKQ